MSLWRSAKFLLTLSVLCKACIILVPWVFHTCTIRILNFLGPNAPSAWQLSKCLLKCIFSTWVYVCLDSSNDAQNSESDKNLNFIRRNFYPQKSWIWYKVAFIELDPEGDKYLGFLNICSEGLMRIYLFIIIQVFFKIQGRHIQFTKCFTMAPCRQVWNTLISS